MFTSLDCILKKRQKNVNNNLEKKENNWTFATILTSTISRQQLVHLFFSLVY